MSSTQKLSANLREMLSTLTDVLEAQGLSPRKASLLSYPLAAFIILFTPVFLLSVLLSALILLACVLAITAAALTTLLVMCVSIMFIVITFAACLSFVFIISLMFSVFAVFAVAALASFSLALYWFLSLLALRGWAPAQKLHSCIDNAIPILNAVPERKYVACGTNLKSTFVPSS